MVLDKCTLWDTPKDPAKTKPKKCAVDLGKYKAASGNLRLPLSRKQNGSVFLTPINKPIEDFAKCMVNVYDAPKEPPTPLLTMLQPAKRARMTSSSSALCIPGPMLTDDLCNNLWAWVAPYKPNTIRPHGNTWKCILTGGLICPKKGAPHTRNNVGFRAVVGKRNINGYYKCMSDTCGVIWHCPTDLRAVCYADQERAKVEKLLLMF